MSSAVRSSRTTKTQKIIPVEERDFTPSAKFAAEIREEMRAFITHLPPVPPGRKFHRKSAAISKPGNTIDRRTRDGWQETYTHYVAVDKYGNKLEWHERCEGQTRLFPREMQARKRLRNDDEYAYVDAAVDAETAEQATPRKASKKRASATASSSSSSSSRHKAPAAPKKDKDGRRARARAADIDDDVDFDDGATTETEASHLARTRNKDHGRRGAAMLGEDLAGDNDDEELGRGKRRCSARLARVKTEPGEGDDLASLCGRVDGLEFRSTAEPGA